MTFTVDSSALQRGIETVILSGRYGDKSSSLENEIMMIGTENNLQLWNGDASLICCVDVPYTTEDATPNAVFSAKDILPFLKKIKGDIEVTIDGNFSISAGTTNISIPLILSHPNEGSIDRIIESCKFTYDFNEDIPTFLSKAFETAMEVSSASFCEALSLSEVVGTGIFTFDVTEDHNLVISSRTNTKNFSTEIVPINFKGERSTVDFTSPLHKFFKNTDTVTIFLKDDFPLYLMSEDRRVLRAPRIE